MQVFPPHPALARASASIATKSSAKTLKEIVGLRMVSITSRANTTQSAIIDFRINVGLVVNSLTTSTLSAAFVGSKSVDLNSKRLHHVGGLSL